MDAILNISKRSMMPEWHQLDSSSTMPQQQESKKKKNFKIKFQVILVFYRTNVYVFGWHSKPVMYCWRIVKRIVKILSKRFVSVLLKHMVNVLLKRILAHC